MAEGHVMLQYPPTGRAAGTPLCLMNRPFHLRPSLVELCVPILCREADILNILATLPPHIRSQVIAKLPLDLPLLPCSQFILDEDYWKRRALLKWKTCDPSCHGDSWKQLFFECNLADALENFDPTLEDGTVLAKLMETSEPFVHSLDIRQLPSRLNMCIVFKFLGRQLTRLKLEYGWRNAGMLYEPEKFGMKVSDCLAFSASLSLAAILTILDLSCNLLDDDKGLSLVSCGLGEEAAASLGRLISSSHSPLLYLDVSANSSIGIKGGAILQASMEFGKPPLYFDLQMCGVGVEIEQFMANAVTTKNERDVRPSLLRNNIFQI